MSSKVYKFSFKKIRILLQGIFFHKYYLHFTFFCCLAFWSISLRSCIQALFFRKFPCASFAICSFCRLVSARAGLFPLFPPLDEILKIVKFFKNQMLFSRRNYLRNEWRPQILISNDLPSPNPLKPSRPWIPYDLTFVAF